MSAPFMGQTFWWKKKLKNDSFVYDDGLWLLQDCQMWAKFPLLPRRLCPLEKKPLFIKRDWVQKNRVDYLPLWSCSFVEYNEIILRWKSLLGTYLWSLKEHINLLTRLSCSWYHMWKFPPKRLFAYVNFMWTVCVSLIWDQLWDWLRSQCFWYISYEFMYF